MKASKTLATLAALTAAFRMETPTMDHVVRKAVGTPGARGRRKARKAQKQARKANRK